MELMLMNLYRWNYWTSKHSYSQPYSIHGRCCHQHTFRSWSRGDVGRIHVCSLIMALREQSIWIYAARQRTIREWCFVI